MSYAGLDTMTSVERMYGLYCAVNYVLSSAVKGDFVECGVWRGGSSMLLAKMLSNRSIVDRKIHLYDTFEGMSEPTGNDFDIKGRKASTLLKETEKNKETSYLWCLAGLEDVRNNMTSTNFPSNNIIYVQGKVEEPFPQLFQKIILLYFV